MMKKVISIILAVCMIALSVITTSGSVVDITGEGKSIYTFGDWVFSAIDGGSHWKIEEYKGSDADIVIPRIENNMMVVSITNHCFMDNTFVKRVETSSPLLTIGDYAFLNATALETFVCNFALKEIGVGAFVGTSSLKDINLENSIVEKIMPYTFLNSGISSAALPETCTEIGYRAFAQCYELEKLVIPRSVTVIDDEAFRFSDKLTIYCYTGSYAAQYAEDKGIDYVLIDAIISTEPPTEPETEAPIPTEEPTDAPTEPVTEEPTTVPPTESEPATEPATETADYILGDADGNGLVDSVDVTFIQRHLAYMPVGIPDDVLIHGDVDGNGKLTIVDATWIQRHLALMTTGLPIGEFVPITP